MSTTLLESELLEDGELEQPKPETPMTVNEFCERLEDLITRLWLAGSNWGVIRRATTTTLDKTDRDHEHKIAPRPDPTLCFSRLPRRWSQLDEQANLDGGPFQDAPAHRCPECGQVIVTAVCVRCYALGLVNAPQEVRRIPR